MDNQEDGVFFKKFKDQLRKHQFTIGITDLAKMTGVSQTQLRYWEQKNYIHSLQTGEKNTTHRYSYGTLMRVHFVKMMLDEGFTLAAAVERANGYGNQMEMMRVFMMTAFQGIEERDGHHMVKLGYFDEDQTQQLYCYILDGKPHYRLYPAKSEG
ncbi:MerR family transcriptional regulator [Lactiplantibacillus pentosus]|uniref:MerR family transcriptional regulator n=1 Tax=Lactiplantibacillus pentosus TaxID=1589 RepID=UPI00234A6888|nr:MerR family transcriptional regulator [Lactiplantibacillus pentosus]MDC6398186.1 MerR family transcriptional regulator [Lactiplantibacillus pentosus]